MRKIKWLVIGLAVLVVLFYTSLVNGHARDFYSVTVVNRHAFAVNVTSRGRTHNVPPKSTYATDLAIDRKDDESVLFTDKRGKFIGAFNCRFEGETCVVTCGP